MIDKIANGRTDLVFEFVKEGNPSTFIDSAGVPLIKWCAYYGDVSATRFLLSQGESLNTLGENFDLNGAVFHGHWQLCQFLLEYGSDVNHALPDTGETPLHSALCTTNRLKHELIIKILLAHGANPNCATKPSIQTGNFMRDCKTKGETPLHRAAAFGNEETIQLLLDAGAIINAKDINGDSPLCWASWYLRPATILRKLCYGDFSIYHEYGGGMEGNLTGKPNIKQ